MINGQEKCAQEGNDILAICPNWALDQMKEKNRFYAKAVAINHKTYTSAMRVEEYNKGRTNADVSDKNWVHFHYTIPNKYLLSYGEYVILIETKKLFF